MSGGNKLPGDTVTVGTTPELLIDKRVNTGIEVIFQNLSEVDVWIWGADTEVGKAIRVTPGMIISDTSTHDEWYGVVETGTADIFVGPVAK